MTFFRTSFGPSAIDDLLDRVDKARGAEGSNISTQNDASPDSSSSVAPTLYDFLDEDDLLPECRSDNERLLSYLSQDSILRELLSLCTKRSNGVISPENVEVKARSAVSRISGSEEALEAKRQFKWPYIASEVLAAEVDKISNAVLNSSELVDALFSFLDEAPGSLDLFLCMHFAKVFSALLRTEHLKVIEKVSQRPEFVSRLIAHVSCAPVAEILVRLMDGPETDEYDPTGNPPAATAVALLTDSDVLGGLSEVFYQAATRRLKLHRIESGPTAADLSEDEKSTQFDRFCEETMESCSSTLLGLTMKVLRMPLMKLEVPKKFNVYGSPEVIGKMLDGGLHSASESLPSSALSFALRTVTELMTTDNNLTPDETSMDQDLLNSFVNGMSPPGRRNFLSGSLTPQHSSRHRGGPMGKPPPSDKDQDSSGAPRTQIMNTRLLEEECRARFGSLVDLLISETPAVAGSLNIENTSGSVQLLGSTRLKLVEFFVSFLKRGNESTLRSLVDFKVPEHLLRICLIHEWNSMAHGIIASAITSALKYGTREIINSTWMSANLVSWLLQAWEKNRALENHDEFHFRLGYMGSLIAIAKELDIYIGKMEENEIEKWIGAETCSAFKALVDGELKEVIEREGTFLGGQRPNASKIVSDDDEEMYEEATEVFDMEGIIDGLSSGDNEAINVFANYLFHKGASGADFEDEEEGIETLDVSDYSDEFQSAESANGNQYSSYAQPVDIHPSDHGSRSDEYDDDNEEDDDDEDDDDQYERFVASPGEDSEDIEEAKSSNIASSESRSEKRSPSLSVEVPEPSPLGSHRSDTPRVMEADDTDSGDWVAFESK